MPTPQITSVPGTADTVPGFIEAGAGPGFVRQPTPLTIAGLKGQTLPIIARVFDSTGVNYITSFSILDVPKFKYTLNGSQQPLAVRVPAALATGPPPDYRQRVMVDKPAGYWRLDDLGTIAVDSSGNSLHGTVTNPGAPTNVMQQGLPGATPDGDFCMGFNNSSSVQIPDNSLLHPPNVVSLEAWAYKTADVNFQRIAEGGSYPNGNFEMSADNTGKMRWLIDYTTGGLSQNVTTPNAMPLNQWVHFVGTWDGTTVKLYQNGVLVASFTPPATTMQAGSGGMGIGAGGGSTGSWNGRLDEVAIYGYALSAAQVLSHYQAGASLYNVLGPGQSPISLGHVIQLAEQGGDNTVLYTGLIDSIPVTYGQETMVELELTPIGAEVGTTDFDKNYATATDVGQMVVDAVQNCQHLWTTPQSVPLTGVAVVYNFQKSHVADVLDTCRTLAGPDYFWYIAPNGQVWFQAVSQTPTYVVKRGQDYNVSKSGASIIDLRNSFTVVGGNVPGTGQALTSTYSNPASIARYSRRTLQPNPYYPNILSQAALDGVKTTLGQILDRPTQKIRLQLVNYPQRIWMAQPGGAVIQYWEPDTSPQPEGLTGQGFYSTPYVVRDVEIDGPVQTLVLDTLPTNISDLNEYLSRIAARLTTYPLFYTPVPLNQSAQAVAGFKLASNAGPGSRYVLDNKAFQIFDSQATPVKRVEEGDLAANGLSPAQFGIRVNDAGGNPIFDSLGLIGVMLWQGQGLAFNRTFTAPSDTLISGTAVTFTMTRSQRVLIVAGAVAQAASQTGRIQVYLDGQADLDNWMIWGLNGPQVATCWVYSDYLPAGSHTFDLRGWEQTGGTLTIQSCSLNVYLLGS